MAHTRKKMFYAPKAFNGYGPPEPPIPAAQDRPGRYPCPCCGQITLPVPPEEAVAYICPVCWWENDVFISSDNEPSDENHGLTLSQQNAFPRLQAAFCSCVAGPDSGLRLWDI